MSYDSFSFFLFFAILIVEMRDIMGNIKIERLNHAVWEELSNILMTEVKDEAISFVTITGCDISSDLSYCKVYVTILDKEKKEEGLKALNHAKSFLRSELAKRIEMRHVPELTFIYDDSIAYFEHIENILEDLKGTNNELQDSNK